MFTFTVTPEHGDPFRVKADSRDIYMWEKTSRDKTLAGLYENMAIVDLYVIAHIASRRQRLFAGDLAEFVTCVLDTEEEEAQAAAPFGPDPSAETASLSPSSPASRRPSGQRRAKKQ
jgi:hypothetical protein